MSEGFKAKTVMVKYSQDGMRLDKVLRELFEAASFGAVQKLCRKGEIRLDGKRVKGNERVEMGQEIRIPPSLQMPVEGKSEKGTKTYHLTTQDKRDIEDMIIFEDDELIVLNKPYGLPVQAGSGHSKSVDRLLTAFAGEDYSPKLVHRIDKTTTGCLVMAKTKEMARELSDQFKFRKANKKYWAFVEGKVMQREGVIKTFMEVEADDDGYEKMSTNKRGQKAETHYEIIDSAGMYHWVEVTPKTGRKHQIRVHLASIGLPIVGDIKYGGKRLGGDDDIPSGKLFLHAREVSFDLESGRHLNFKADLPDHFKKVFDLMQWKAK